MRPRNHHLPQAGRRRDRRWCSSSSSTLLALASSLLASACFSANVCAAAAAATAVAATPCVAPDVLFPVAAASSPSAPATSSGYRCAAALPQLPNTTSVPSRLYWLFEERVAPPPSSGAAAAPAAAVTARAHFRCEVQVPAADTVADAPGRYAAFGFGQTLVVGGLVHAGNPASAVLHTLEGGAPSAPPVSWLRSGVVSLNGTTLSLSLSLDVVPGRLGDAFFADNGTLADAAAVTLEGGVLHASGGTPTQPVVTLSLQTAPRAPAAGAFSLATDAAAAQAEAVRGDGAVWTLRAALPNGTYARRYDVVTNKEKLSLSFDDYVNPSVAPATGRGGGGGARSDVSAPLPVVVLSRDEYASRVVAARARVGAAAASPPPSVPPAPGAAEAEVLARLSATLRDVLWDRSGSRGEGPQASLGAAVVVVVEGRFAGGVLASARRREEAALRRMGAAAAAANLSALHEQVSSNTTRLVEAAREVFLDSAFRATVAFDTLRPLLNVTVALRADPAYSGTADPGGDPFTILVNGVSVAGAERGSLFYQTVRVARAVAGDPPVPWGGRQVCADESSCTISARVEPEVAGVTYAAVARAVKYAAEAAVLAAAVAAAVWVPSLAGSSPSLPLKMHAAAAAAAALACPFSPGGEGRRWVEPFSHPLQFSLGGSTGQPLGGVAGNGALYLAALAVFAVGSWQASRRSKLLKKTPLEVLEDKLHQQQDAMNDADSANGGAGGGGHSAAPGAGANPLLASSDGVKIAAKARGDVLFLALSFLSTGLLLCSAQVLLGDEVPSAGAAAAASAGLALALVCPAYTARVVACSAGRHATTLKRKHYYREVARRANAIQAHEARRRRWLRAQTQDVERQSTKQDWDVDDPADGRDDAKAAAAAAAAAAADTPSSPPRASVNALFTPSVISTDSLDDSPFAGEPAWRTFVLSDAFLTLVVGRRQWVHRQSSATRYVPEGGGGHISSAASAVSQPRRGGRRGRGYPPRAHGREGAFSECYNLTWLKLHRSLLHPYKDTKRARCGAGYLVLEWAASGVARSFLVAWSPASTDGCGDRAFALLAIPLFMLFCLVALRPYERVFDALFDFVFYAVEAALHCVAVSALWSGGADTALRQGSGDEEAAEALTFVLVALVLAKVALDVCAYLFVLWLVREGEATAAAAGADSPTAPSPHRSPAGFALDAGGAAGGAAGADDAAGAAAAGAGGRRRASTGPFDPTAVAAAQATVFSTTGDILSTEGSDGGASDSETSSAESTASVPPAPVTPLVKLLQGSWASEANPNSSFVVISVDGAEVTTVESAARTQSVEKLHLDRRRGAVRLRHASLMGFGEEAGSGRVVAMWDDGSVWNRLPEGREDEGGGGGGGGGRASYVPSLGSVELEGLQMRGSLILEGAAAGDDAVAAKSQTRPRLPPPPPPPPPGGALPVSLTMQRARTGSGTMRLPGIGQVEDSARGGGSDAEDVVVVETAWGGD